METAIRIVGGKWKLLLIRVLLDEGPQRFNELARAVPDISAKVLTENLRELEESGILARDERRYAISAAGAGLMPILYSLGEWAESVGESIPELPMVREAV